MKNKKFTSWGGSPPFHPPPEHLQEPTTMTEPSNKLLTKQTILYLTNYLPLPNKLKPLTTNQKYNSSFIEFRRNTTEFSEGVFIHSNRFLSCSTTKGAISSFLFFIKGRNALSEITPMGVKAYTRGVFIG